MPELESWFQYNLIIYLLEWILHHTSFFFSIKVSQTSLINLAKSKWNKTKMCFWASWHLYYFYRPALLLFCTEGKLKKQKRYSTSTLSHVHKSSLKLCTFAVELNRKIFLWPTIAGGGLTQWKPRVPFYTSPKTSPLLHSLIH